MRRPQNHVTRAMDAARMNFAANPDPEGGYPYVPAKLLERFEADYPPRCKEIGESDEAHQRYAGVVDFIKNLRATHNRVADFAKTLPSGDNLDAEAEELVRQANR